MGRCLELSVVLTHRPRLAPRWAASARWARVSCRPDEEGGTPPSPAIDNRTVTSTAKADGGQRCQSGWMSYEASLGGGSEGLG